MRPTPGRVAAAAGFALCLGLSLLVLTEGFSSDFIMRALQGIAVFVVGATVILIPAIWIAQRMANYRAPESEAEFEQVVQRSEELAAEGVELEPSEDHFLELDPYDPEGFAEIIREALDELPPELRRALDRNIAVTIRDDGRRMRAYGLYRGDTVARDDHPRQIIIYRDTLLRDFGHDPTALRDQITRTVRHELAHHLGWDELGVRGLGL
jgi:predicted Zn-dependent protease with MMP-like domain